MLYLNPPYYVVKDHTLFPDHEDPSKFYVLPHTPVPGITEDNKPDISLLQYLGGTAEEKVAGGLLTFSTELKVSSEKIKELKAYLNTEDILPAGHNLQLIPVLFDSGTVELVALGTGREANEMSPEEGGAGSFDINILGAGRPSLSTTNKAVFQLVLDPNAAELVERALDLPELPVIVIYRMNFAGLRPSFQIDIKADWKKVYHSLEQKADINLYYGAVNAEMLIDEALAENNVEIDTEIYGTEESDRTAAEKAKKQLTAWVLENMFKPVIDPGASEAGAIGSTVEKTVWSVVRSLVPGVTYRLRSVKEEQLRLLSARMNESVAESREIIAQGTFGSFLADYRLDEDGNVAPDWPEIRDHIVNKINLSGFPVLEVVIAAEDRFASDGISSIQVEVARLNSDNSLTDNRTFYLRDSSERELYSVNLLGAADRVFSIPYQYRFTVKFDPTGIFGTREAVSSEWTTARTTELFVEPRQVYTIKEVKVNLTPVFSFMQFPSVTVELRYRENEIDDYQRGNYQFDEENTNKIWRFRSFAAAPFTYQYRITYHRPGEEGGSIRAGWQESCEEWLSVPDPLPNKRHLHIFANLPWSEIQVGFLRVKYEDTENDIHYDEHIDLDKNKLYIRRDYPVAADGLMTLQYRLTLLLNTGELLEGSWRQTDEDRLVLDRMLVDRKAVSVKTIAGDLVENNLDRVKVILQVREPGTDHIKEEKQIIINQNNFEQLHSWEYLIGDPPIFEFFYRGHFIDVNGFVESTPWLKTKSDMLVINLRNKSISG